MPPSDYDPLTKYTTYSEQRQENRQPLPPVPQQWRLAHKAAPWYNRPCQGGGKRGPYQGGGKRGPYQGGGERGPYQGGGKRGLYR